MNTIKYLKIMVTYDGSELAAAALPHAAALARACGSEVYVLHVIEPNPQLAATPGVYAPATITLDRDAEILRQNKRKARAQLEAIKNDLYDASVDMVRVHVDVGMPREVIIDTAKSEKTDLIIMSTHGRSGLGRVLMGSVTDYVVRHAPCPVLVVHNEENVISH